jgi:hypothetical protein
MWLVLAALASAQTGAAFMPLRCLPGPHQLISTSLVCPSPWNCGGRNTFAETSIAAQAQRARWACAL